MTKNSKFILFTTLISISSINGMELRRRKKQCADKAKETLTQAREACPEKIKSKLTKENAREACSFCEVFCCMLYCCGVLGSAGKYIIEAEDRGYANGMADCDHERESHAEAFEALNKRTMEYRTASEQCALKLEKLQDKLDGKLDWGHTDY